MAAIEHPDYNEELTRLNYTLEYLNSYNSNIKNEKERVDKEVSYGWKNFNMDNPDQFNALVTNKILKGNLEQKLRNLDKSLSKPYFARVNFRENGSREMQSLYIGKVSLLREEDQEPIIVDWRAPIATLYYEGRLGEAGYSSDDEYISGNISLKRQYTIEEAKLKEIYDSDITTSDDFLQAALGGSKDSRLKDIVSTIQAEQNKVIRADMWKPLIVQGAAGGGKTTLALHRIAYLLYNNEKTLDPSSFMIMAPNRFFLSYISEVLPELGVENVYQTTFEDFALKIIGRKIKINNYNEKLAEIINNRGLNDRNNLIKSASGFKSSLTFKKIIEDYIEIIEKNFMPHEDFKIRSFVLLKYEEIRNLFINNYSNLPLDKRVKEIRKTLTNTIKIKKSSLLESIEAEYDKKIDRVRINMEDSQKRRKIIIELADERDSILWNINIKSKTIVKEYISKIKRNSPIDYYKKLINDKELFNQLCSKYVDENLAENTRLETLKNLSKDHIEIEDLSPIMYIKYKVSGLDEKLDIRHVVIDEAQDYSEFQLDLIREIIGGSSFTILGDLCQGIYSYRGISNWQNVSDKIFGEDNYSMLTLEQSYRTTIEIMEGATSVIKSLKDITLPLAKPVIRHGEKIAIIERNCLNKIIEDIHYKLSNELKVFKSAAIICKTIEECRVMEQELKNYSLECGLITGNEEEYNGGVVIVPSYLSKGLEFDVVIIANTNKESYKTEELDVKLLYVGMTRALHKLYIYSLGEKSEIFEGMI